MANENKPNAIARYVRETTGELKKVSWPTRAEARQLTVIVLIVMLFMALYLGLVDAGGSWLIGLILGK